MDIRSGCPLDVILRRPQDISSECPQDGQIGSLEDILGKLEGDVLRKSWGPIFACWGFAIFDSYLSYCYLVWAQNCSTIQGITILQKKAVRIINFQPRNSHNSFLFKQSFILKFQDKICLENILFFSKSLNNLSPSLFNTWFSFSSDQHNYETSSSTQGNLIKPFHKTDRYGKCSVTINAVESWNKVQKQLKICYLKIYPPIKLKQLLLIFILNHIRNSC